MRYLLRAILLRCPVCGGGGLRLTWTRMRNQCPHCGLRFDRGESDYFLGAYTVNLVAALLLAVGITVLGVTGVLPKPVIYAGGIGAIVVFALWFHPFSRLLWLAVDLVMRPPMERDRN